MDKEQRNSELIKAGLLSVLFKTARIFEAGGFVSRSEFESFYSLSTKAKDDQCYCEDLLYKQEGDFGVYLLKVHIGIFTYKCSFNISNAPGKFPTGTLVTRNYDVVKI